MPEALQHHQGKSGTKQSTGLLVTQHKLAEVSWVPTTDLMQAIEEAVKVRESIPMLVKLRLKANSISKDTGHSLAICHNQAISNRKATHRSKGILNRKANHVPKDHLTG